MSNVRIASEIEELIVEYCFPFSHHLNASCSRLGCADFEKEPFKASDMLDAAKAILRHESSKGGYKSKLKLKLLAELPEYIRRNQGRNLNSERICPYLREHRRNDANCEECDYFC